MITLAKQLLKPLRADLFRAHSDPLEKRLRTLRDIRDERDWKRPWIDPPGMGWWNPCCCPSSPSSTSGPVKTTTCCPSGIPLIIHVTFNNTGKCPFFDGLTFPMTFGNSAAPLGWSVATDQCPGPSVQFAMVCQTGGVGNWSASFANISPSCLGLTFTRNAGGTCFPLNFVFTGNPGPCGGCCTSFPTGLVATVTA